MRLSIPALLAAFAALPLTNANADHHNKKLYPEIVQPILTAKCAGCHGEDKQKGKLRVDTFAELMKGGSEGESVVAGK